MEQNDKYVLTLTTEQLLTVSKACEFYSRVMMGQFREIAFETMMQSIKHDDFCTRRDMMEDLLIQARQFAFPDLTDTTNPPTAHGTHIRRCAMPGHGTSIPRAALLSISISHILLAVNPSRIAGC